MSALRAPIAAGLARLRRVLRDEVGSVSWTDIVLALLLVVVIWVFQNQIGDLIQWMTRSLFDGIRDAAEPAATPTPTRGKS